jgi:hypothetical protein
MSQTAQIETFRVPPRWLFVRVETHEGAGLGIEIDEARVREAARIPHEWRSPVWRGPDGSVREW